MNTVTSGPYEVATGHCRCLILLESSIKLFKVETAVVTSGL